ncbi:ThiF family adenylyltransferase [Sanyastnella coralliicola]|uniref:ThiF family adenylyltransferase n=1 Tax=Sanyastnella coralliicola TaxID=3069118 RepID=UPI0027BA1726|nr:ThiF family adenylyltransferase [Longitalea sp. SCSIO 12813]
MAEKQLIVSPQIQELKPWSVQRFSSAQIADGTWEAFVEEKEATIIDTIEDQVAELVQMRRPSYAWKENEVTLAVRARLGENPEQYGVWVYYPWRNAMVHLLDEAEYREVRTNRNMHKVSATEQGVLAKKRIAIAGMSVGSGIALTLALERIGGELIIADYDNLELSNMNRLRTSVVNLSLPKATIVAREIAELDPYIKVTVFEEGVTHDNIDEFLGGDTPIDLLLEECDSFIMKLKLRWEARKKGIPVVMDTSDRGLIDVERFDLDDSMELFHGRFSDEEIEQVLETEEWNPEWLFRMITQDELSERMKFSMSELNKTISRWPQLGSEVIMGAGVAAQLSRMILLGDNQITGRKFVDVSGFFLDK